MSKTTTLECTKHGLRFEQFDDWSEVKGGAIPKCYICAHEDMKSLRDQLQDVTRQRDALLAAIEVKLSMPVSPERSLTKS